MSRGASGGSRSQESGVRDGPSIGATCAANLRTSLRLCGPWNAGEPGTLVHTAAVLFADRGEAPLQSVTSVGGRHVHQDPVRKPLARESSSRETSRIGPEGSSGPSMLHRPSRRVAHHEQESPRLVRLGTEGGQAWLRSAATECSHHLSTVVTELVRVVMPERWAGPAPFLSRLRFM